MRTCLYIAILLALTAAGTAAATQVTKVDLFYADGGSVARIEVQGPFQFTHKTVEPKDGKPDRLILDVLGATHNWGPKEWLSLPPCGVKVVRIGQFSSKPDQIVRVVFELSKAPIYRVDSDGKSIKIHFTDNAVKQFAAWSTGAAPSEPPVIAPAPPTAAKPASAPVAVVPKPATPTVAVTPKPEVKPAQPAVKPVPTHADLAKTAPATPPVVSKPVVVAPKAAVTGTPQEKPAEKKPVVTTSRPVPANPKPTTPAVVATEPKPASSAAAPAVKSETKPAAPVAAPAPAKQSLTVAPPTGAKTAPAPAPTVEKQESAAQPAPKPSVPLVLAPKAEAETPKPVTPATPAPASVQKPLTAPDDKPAPAVVSTDKPVVPPSDKHAPATATPATPAAAAADKPVLADVDTPTDGSASGSARPTARFRRSANSKMKSSLVAEFPQRLVVKYESMGYRDPFATLIDDTRTYDEPLVQRVPNVDGLKLVGVIESPDGDNRALFEDKHKFSYILKSGDKVQKGYVLRVEDDRVYFQIFEYGWSRTIALTLENRN